MLEDTASSYPWVALLTASLCCWCEMPLRNWACRRFSPSVHKTAQLLYHWQLAGENSQEQLMILEARATEAATEARSNVAIFLWAGHGQGLHDLLRFASGAPLERSELAAGMGPACQEMCAGNPEMLKNILTRLMHCVSGGVSEKFLTMMQLGSGSTCCSCGVPV